MRFIVVVLLTLLTPFSALAQTVTIQNEEPVAAYRGLELYEVYASDGAGITNLCEPYLIQGGMNDFSLCVENFTKIAGQGDTYTIDDSGNQGLLAGVIYLAPLPVSAIVQDQGVLEQIEEIVARVMTLESVVADGAPEDQAVEWQDIDTALAAIRDELIAAAAVDERQDLQIRNLTEGLIDLTQATAGQGERIDRLETALDMLPEPVEPVTAEQIAAVADGQIATAFAEADLAGQIAAAVDAASAEREESYASTDDVSEVATQVIELEDQLSDLIQRTDEVIAAAANGETVQIPSEQDIADIVKRETEELSASLTFNLQFWVALLVLLVIVALVWIFFTKASKKGVTKSINAVTESATFAETQARAAHTQLVGARNAAEDARNKAEKALAAVDNLHEELQAIIEFVGSDRLKVANLTDERLLGLGRKDYVNLRVPGTNSKHIHVFREGERLRLHGLASGKDIVDKVSSGALLKHLAKAVHPDNIDDWVIGTTAANAIKAQAA